MGEMRNSHKVLVYKPEGQRPLRGKPKRRWEDTIRIGPEKIQLAGMN